MQGVKFSHFLMERHISSGDRVIDATVGNGHDTVFLARLVGENGFVWGFDIQEKAIENTSKKLHNNNLSNRVKLIQSGHEQLASFVDKPVKGVLFNLGYLPGSDKKIITTPSCTLAALEAGLKLLAKEGLIVLVIYSGHRGGEKEKSVLLKYCSHLSEEKYNVLNYNFINQSQSPARVLAIKAR